MTAQILSEQQRRLHNIATIGTVFDVNPDDQTMRLDVGDNQTDWLPIPALAAGQVRVWRCPSVGEQFLLVSPSGELANAIPVLSLYSNQHPSPSHDPNAKHRKQCYAIAEQMLESVTVSYRQFRQHLAWAGHRHPTFKRALAAAEAIPCDNDKQALWFWFRQYYQG